MAFDFRTTNWNGVLMSISDPRTYPALGLEMVGGQVSHLCRMSNFENGNIPCHYFCNFDLKKTEVVGGQVSNLLGPLTGVSTVAYRILKMAISPVIIFAIFHVDLKKKSFTFLRE